MPYLTSSGLLRVHKAGQTERDSHQPNLISHSTKISHAQTKISRTQKYLTHLIENLTIKQKITHSNGNLILKLNYLTKTKMSQTQTKISHTETIISHTQTKISGTKTTISHAQTKITHSN